MTAQGGRRAEMEQYGSRPFLNVTKSRAVARELLGPSDRPTTKAWRPRNPVARATSMLAPPRPWPFRKGAVLVSAASRIASDVEANAADGRFTADAWMRLTNS
jgi:hypothetical protein